MQLALLQSSHIDAPRNAPSASRGGRFTLSVKDTVTLWLELKRRYAEDRGFDPDPRNKRSAVPRTTNVDVIQMASLWTAELGKGAGRMKGGDVKRWTKCMDEVKRFADPKEANAVYPRNTNFWRCSGRLARDLESLKVIPGKWELLRESVSESVAELPGRLEDAAKATGRAAADAGGAVAGFFADPLKLAALAIGGAVLLPPVIRAINK